MVDRCWRLLGGLLAISSAACLANDATHGRADVFGDGVASEEKSGQDADEPEDESKGVHDPVGGTAGLAPLVGGQNGGRDERSGSGDVEAVVGRLATLDN